MSELEGYLDFGKRLAVEAGGIMHQNFLDSPTREWKEDTTPLTATDTQINTLVIERVKNKFPNHGVWGEEESHNLGAEFTWVCDPVDGTMPFSHGLPISTFSLALTRQGQPIAGVVYDPFLKRLFWAAKGYGAFLNGKKIKVTDSQDLKNALIDLEGFPKSSKPVIQDASGFVELLNKNEVHTTALWSVILPGVLVAAGQFTAVIFNVTKPEDGASIKVIVEEAGGKVTDLFGDDQRYDQPIKGFIASNGKVHQRLVDMLAKFSVTK